MLTRRRLLLVGFGTIATLSATAVAARVARAGPEQERGARPAALDPAARSIVAAIAPVMLAGALPPGDAFQTALREVVQGTDTAVAGLTPSAQREVGQLFGLLGFPPARIVVAGVLPSWDRASSTEIERFLQAWRSSPIERLRSAYDALHQLIDAAWYGNPRSWSRIAYPGPPVLGKE